MTQTPEHEKTATPAANNAASYWRENIKLLAVLLSIWFTVSFGFGILLADALNNLSIGGYPLGFWFAQQGSILVFVILIFVYAARISKIEKRFGVGDE